MDKLTSETRWLQEEDQDDDDEMDKLIIIETEDNESENKNAIEFGDDVIKAIQVDEDNKAKRNKHEKSYEQTDPRNQNNQETAETSKSNRKLEKWVINKETTREAVELSKLIVDSNIERPALTIQMEKWLKSCPTSMPYLSKSHLPPPPINRKNWLKNTIAEEEPVIIKTEIPDGNLNTVCPNRLPSDEMTMPKVEDSGDVVFLSPPAPPLLYKRPELFNNEYQTSSIRTPEGIKKIENWMNNTRKQSKEGALEERLYYLALPRDFEIKLDKQLAEKNLEFLSANSSPGLKITGQSQTNQRLDHFPFNQPITSAKTLPTTGAIISNPQSKQKNHIKSSNPVILTPKTTQQILETQAAVAPEPEIVTTKNTGNSFNRYFQPTTEPTKVTTENLQSDPVQTVQDELVVRKFTQHQMDYNGISILLLNFYSRFTLLIPEREELLEEQEAVVEVKMQQLGDTKKLTFIRFIFDSINSEITAPVLHADHIHTGLELIRNKTPCVFLGQPFENVEDVDEPAQSNIFKNTLFESASFDANCSGMYATPVQEPMLSGIDHISPPDSMTMHKKQNSKNFEESEIATPNSIKRIETWMNKLPNAMADQSGLMPVTKHVERWETSGPLIKNLLLNPSTAANTGEIPLLELPTVIQHQSSANINEKLSNVPYVFDSGLDVSQLPISGDVIMGTHSFQAADEISDKSFIYIGSDCHSNATLNTKQQSLRSEETVVKVLCSETFDELSDDEPPQKICRLDPKPGSSYLRTTPPVSNQRPIIPSSFSTPSSDETPNYDIGNVQNDPEYALKFAELERRLNEPLPIPLEENHGEDTDELTVTSEDGEVDEVAEDLSMRDDDEEFILPNDKKRKSKAITQEGSSNRESGPRPSSARGRLKNCDKISRWLVTLLRDPSINPSVITWINPEDGVFKIVNSAKLATLWGKKKGNPNMDYSKLSRAMRYYYKTGELEVVNSRLTYRFGDRMTNWRPINAADPNFISKQNGVVTNTVKK